MSIKSPTGHDIVGILVSVPGIALISNVRIVPTELGYPNNFILDYEYAGETEMLWDEQDEAPFNYLLTFIDDDNDQWTEREILDGNHPVQPE